MTTTIATLPRITASALSSIILTQSPNPKPFLAIIDVRDDGTFLCLLLLKLAQPSSLARQSSPRLTNSTDHIGGHILGSTHVPSATLDYKIPELVRKLQDKDTVVFHCALSQQRGPGAALRYLRERERLLGARPKADGFTNRREELKSGSGKDEMGDEEEEEAVGI